MILCKDCGIPMVSVMHFGRENNQKYNQCPKCKQETKHVKLQDSELVFREILNKQLNKQLNKK